MPKPEATDPRAPCSGPDCGRRAYARGLCQTHRRQMMETGTLRPIRPYRERSEGTVKLGGLRVTHHCAELVTAHAERHGLSVGAAIADILEGWHGEGRKAPESETD